jgi:hypothetical protein
MILEIKRNYIPVGHSEWQRTEYLTTVWQINTENGEAVLTVREPPDGYIHGLLSTYIDRRPVTLQEFDDVLGKIGLSRNDIHKEIIA